MNIRNLLKIPNYRPLNTIEINKKNLLSNYKYLSSLNRKVKIVPVIKSNGYGHGIIAIAKILEKNLPAGRQVPLFCVDSLFEAYELLKADIKTPILIMGYVNPESLKVKKLPFSYAVFDLKILQAINEFQPEASVHLFIDTGMHREGIPLDLLPTYLKQITRLPNINVVGIMSHLASADNRKDQLNKLQINNFKKAIKIIEDFGHKPKFIHLQNSDGLINMKLKTNLARTGLSLYGISKNTNLKPVLSFKTKIIEIKRLKKGDRVGYSGIFRVKKDTVVGILPVGYFDGVDRRLSNKGFVTVNGIVCKIIGIVSMNITTIDLSEVENPLIGHEVTIYSNNPKGQNSISKAAEICKTIPYELLVHLTPSIKRLTLD